MTENKHWRKPTLQAIVATFVGVFLFSSLGVWQLQRAKEKRQIQQEIQERKDSRPQAFSFPISDPVSLRHLKIRAQGKFISDHQFILDNRFLDHQVGFNILTPFKLIDSDKVVLVDRGWLPLEGPRENLPNIEVDENLRTLVGTVYVPYGKAFSIGEIDHTTTWPRLIQFIDFELLSARFGHNLLPLTLRMQAGQADTYKAKWPVVSATKNRSLGYAFQWFALAFAVLVIFIVLHMPKSKYIKYEK